MKFSILMSIYYKEKPAYFNRAMKSIWDEQTVKPNEIVIVQDGKLTNDLYEIIGEWQDKLDENLKVVCLEQNIGLGDALNEGIRYCNYELIARMDTDDIALPNRFEKQLKIFENREVDICSSWVSEFDENENEIISFRKLPENHNDIVIYFKMRNGINHPSVMYKKSMVQKAGGYQRMIWFEDYYLWSRMILTGAKFYNIQEPLVNMRSGYKQLERRAGIKYAIEEFKFLRRLKIIEFLTTSQFLKSVFIRFPIRLIPKVLLKKIYSIVRIYN